MTGLIEKVSDTVGAVAGTLKGAVGKLTGAGAVAGNSGGAAKPVQRKATKGKGQRAKSAGTTSAGATSSETAKGARKARKKG